MQIGNVSFGVAMALTFLSLVFGLFHNTVCGATREGARRLLVGLEGRFGLLSLCCLFCLGYASDELQEPVSVALGGDSGYLRLRVRQALEKMFHPLDERVLRVLAEVECTVKW